MGVADGGSANPIEVSVRPQLWADASGVSVTVRTNSQFDVWELGHEVARPGQEGQQQRRQRQEQRTGVRKMAARLRMAASSRGHSGNSGSAAADHRSGAAVDPGVMRRWLLVTTTLTEELHVALTAGSGSSEVRRRARWLAVSMHAPPEDDDGVPEDAGAPLDDITLLIQ